MRFLFIFITFIIAATSSLTENEQWIAFKKNHLKFYSYSEEKLRFQIFKNNLKIIESHNAKYEAGESSYFMGINKFADLTAEEFHQMLLLTNDYEDKSNLDTASFSNNLEVPDAYDWRDHGAVLEVRDQGECGGCWAFSAIEAIEGQNAIINNITIPLSVQELIDCSEIYGNQGCSGGLPRYGFAFVSDHGIQAESTYVYTGKDGDCEIEAGDTILKIKGFKRVNKTDDDLKKAIATIGPISVAMNADLLQLYKGGILDDPSCINSTYTLNHAVLAVGYSEENGKSYWIVKNSWSSDWGEKGYFRIVRNPSQCGILLDASYPIL